ncbi:MAG TPA: hypothetical protein VJH03_01045 [Blastocatellia bacterium]|nr:hypothetical protein [Blastocatellia bacterium]
MTTPLDQQLPKLSHLPVTLPRVGGIDLQLEQGVLIFRVSEEVQTRIEELVHKQQQSGLSPAEEQELSQYEEVDDYLSYINRLVRNLAQRQQAESMISAS